MYYNVRLLMNIVIYFVHYRHNAQATLLINDKAIISEAMKSRR